MAGPQNAVVGNDANMGMDLPEPQVDQEAIKALRQAAKFARSKEFKILKEHLEQRISYYQNFLPGAETEDGAILKQRRKDLEGNWVIANAIIGEFKSIITSFESATEDLKQYEATQRETAQTI